MADAPVATVAIPARDEEAAIGRCLEAVLASDEPRLQVLVVDGASTDGTADIVRRLAKDDDRIELLYNEAGIIPVGLNLALREARAPRFIRIDAHATVPPDYVRRAVADLEAGWGGVGGRKDGVGQTPAGHAIAAAMHSRFGVGGSTYHHGTTEREVDHVPFGAYPTDLARSLGGWDERLRVNQDFEFDRRLRLAGHRILFDPRLRIDWECRQSIRDLFRQYRRYGRGKAVVAALHPGSVRLRHLIAPAFVAALATSSVLGLRRPRLLAAVMIPYVVALMMATSSTAKDTPPGDRRWIAPAFAAMHIGWGLGFWEGTACVASRIIRRRDVAAG